MDKPFEHVALIGLGLIASSIARTLQSQGELEEGERPKITGTARSRATRQRSRKLGFCDYIAESASEAVRKADLVILCAPVGALGEIMSEIAPHIREGAVISDVGSVKGEVARVLTPLIPDHAHFVPAHPLAGTEKSGPEAGFAGLFQNRWCILTPKGADEISRWEDAPEPIRRVADFWQGLGAHVEIMDAAHHDLVLSVTSHIPHLIAYTMVGVADDLSRVTKSEITKYSAAGFRDFTRIAASDPTMWRDVFLTNKEAVLDILGRFTEELFSLQRAIRTGDGERLFEYFAHTRGIRRSIVEIGQDTDLADFGRNLTGASGGKKEDE